MEKDLNLLPSIIIKQRKRRQYTRLATLLCILVFISAFSLLLLPLNNILQLKAKKEYFQQSIKALSYIEEREKKLAVARQALEMRRNVMTEIESKEINFLDFLERTEGIIPSQISLVSIAITGNKVSINGNAENELVIADFLHNMKKLNRFQDVFIPSISEVKNNKGNNAKTMHTFIMEAVLKVSN